MGDKEMKKCPFCGGEAILIPTSRCSGYIACVGKCGIETSKFWDNLLEHEAEKSWKEKALEIWNKRV